LSTRFRASEPAPGPAQERTLPKDTATLGAIAKVHDVLARAQRAAWRLEDPERIEAAATTDRAALDPPKRLTVLEPERRNQAARPLAVRSGTDRTPLGTHESSGGSNIFGCENGSRAVTVTGSMSNTESSGRTRSNRWSRATSFPLTPPSKRSSS
jgi:hypothetical protein